MGPTIHLLFALFLLFPTFSRKCSNIPTFSLYKYHLHDKNAEFGSSFALLARILEISYCIFSEHAAITLQFLIFNNKSFSIC